MIFFTAINDIKKGSKFFNSILTISKTKNDLIWGITELSISTFKKINRDDYILFYHKSEIIGIGQILATKTDKNLSIDLFGTYNHKYKGILHWSNLLYLSKFYPIKIEFDFFKEIGGYSPKFSVRKLIGLNQSGSDKIIENYNSYEKFIMKIIKEYGTQQSV
jgi:hypothetical protein